MSEVSIAEAAGQGAGLAAPEHHRTHPKSFILGGIKAFRQLLIPIAIAIFTIFDDVSPARLILILVPLLIALPVVLMLPSYVSWRRLTYIVGDQDIRVESGVLSRAARSVPYERIQDVSLEQKLLARIFGLVEVKFETGAGAGEDLSLAYLTSQEGNRLRQLVRERREGQAAEALAPGEQSASATDEEAARTLFAMGPRRLIIFGTFEFSLAVFAVLAGLLQYADNLVDFEIWDPDIWQNWIEEQSGVLSNLGAYAQALSAIAGLIAVFVIGSVTGLVRVFVREWGFLLERTQRGFRRRRGLLTKTDVVMPVHRVQGIKIGTGWLRYRFGWMGLRFVSLAQDAGAANHDVAPFARRDEIAPIAAEAGFSLPDEGADWHRASTNYRADSMIKDALAFIIAAIAAAVVLTVYAPDWALGVTLLFLGLAGLSAGGALYSWQFKRHALDENQVMSRAGLLSPQTQIAKRVKLHSVEISQGPIAQLRGYATLHLGQAGGTFSIPGVPIARAHQVRRDILDTIRQTDFSQLEHG